MVVATGLATAIEFCTGVSGSIAHPEVVLSTAALTVTVAIAPLFIHLVNGLGYCVVMGDNFRKRDEDVITALT
jgi:hypothetical protein